MFEKEILKTKQEEEAIKGSLLTAQIAFANKIKNGLGDRMKDEIKNPPKPNKRIAFFCKIRSLIKKIFSVC